MNKRIYGQINFTSPGCRRAGQFGNEFIAKHLGKIEKGYVVTRNGGPSSPYRLNPTFEAHIDMMEKQGWYLVSQETAPWKSHSGEVSTRYFLWSPHPAMPLGDDQ